MIYAWIQLIFGLIVVGILGAKISKEINLGNLSWYWAILASILSGGLWGWFVRQPVSLTYASIVFDVFYTAAYIGTFVFLGDQLNLINVLGIIIAMTGIAMMGYH